MFMDRPAPGTMHGSRMHARCLANHVAPSLQLQHGGSISCARAHEVYAARFCPWSETHESASKCDCGTLLMISSSADVVQ
jgi:hypothetical protein